MRELKGQLADPAELGRQKDVLVEGTSWSRGGSG